MSEQFISKLLHIIILFDRDHNYLIMLFSESYQGVRRRGEWLEISILDGLIVMLQTTFIHTYSRYSNISTIYPYLLKV